MESLIIAGVLVLIAILIVFSTIKIVPQAQAGIVERLGPLQPDPQTRDWRSSSRSSTAFGR